MLLYLSKYLGSSPLLQQVKVVQPLFLWFENATVAAHSDKNRIQKVAARSRSLFAEKADHYTLL